VAPSRLYRFPILFVKWLLIVTGGGIAAVIILLVGIWASSEIFEPLICKEAERIVTKEQAITYAKPFVRNWSSLWRYGGVSDRNEIERLTDENCCSVVSDPPEYLDSRKWRVGFSRFDYDYDLTFNECGMRVVEGGMEQLSRRAFPVR
jgi:hypothetical protein